MRAFGTGFQKNRRGYLLHARQGKLKLVDNSMCVNPSAVDFSDSFFRGVLTGTYFASFEYFIFMFYVVHACIGANAKSLQLIDNLF